MNSKNKLIVISGPTASGKSSLAIELAARLNTVVISADSRQFYREIPIGTAQVPLEEQRGITHFFMGDRSLHQELNAGSFAEEARKKIDLLFNDYEIVLVCGGSGLYIKSLLFGMDALPEADPEIRNQLNQQWEKGEKDQLIKQLRALDPDYSAQADLNNPQRVIRALEVCLITGQAYSQLLSSQKTESYFPCKHFCLMPERQKIYENIQTRTEIMFEQGMESEARSVYPFRELNTLKTVGYKELFQYFEGSLSLEKARELIIQHTRNYAKRQVTWFKNQLPSTFIAPESADLIMKEISEN